MQTRIYTDLTAEPVTLAEAKKWCKVSGTAEDDMIGMLITVARKAMEKYTSSSFGKKTIYATWTKMPEDWIVDLPYGPIISVDRVYRIDEEGNEELLTVNQDYFLSGENDIQVQVSQFWSTGIVSAWSLRIEYTAGYDDTATEPLPEELKTAILKQVATDYLFRENITTGSTTVLSNDARNVASPYRKMTLL
jgi:uncharacterized phiE125 gp8 family phage protein